MTLTATEFKQLLRNNPHLLDAQQPEPNSEQVSRWWLDVFSFMKPGFVIALTHSKRVYEIPVKEFPRKGSEAFTFERGKYSPSAIPAALLDYDTLRRFEREGIPVS